jgi:hypothetical protein
MKGQAMATFGPRSIAVGIFGLLAGIVLLQSLSCSLDEESTLDEERRIWNGAAAFLAGVYTVANMEDLDPSGFETNFRSNYDWIKNVFLPHLEETEKHDWQICDNYCIEMAKRMANGDEEKEKELREKLTEYRHGHQESK